MIHVTTCTNLIKTVLSERRQSGRNTYCMKWTEEAKRLLVAQCWGEKGYVVINKHNVPFRVMYNFLKLDCGIVAQFKKYTKMQQTVQLKQIDFMVCKWHLNKRHYQTLPAIPQISYTNKGFRALATVEIAVDLEEECQKTSTWI